MAINKERKIFVNNGFTMLEVMLAIAITAVILSFIGMALISAARLNTLSSAQNEAGNLAEKKIEELRRYSYSTIESGSDNIDDFSRTWIVVDNMGKPRIKDVELTVSWFDSKHNQHNVTYHTVFYRNAYPYK
ncbi:prepilin-type N-terminal cleavage/methylation domain-containing protein [bacterium]|nr:prepilin-type N-terminal cleavage/methylation domain-containing protein [bacterium]